MQRCAAIVRGEEHFVDALTCIVCAGAPIEDLHAARLIGVLALVCSVEGANALLLPLANETAREIEQRLISGPVAAERLLEPECLPPRRCTRRPLVLVSEKLLLTNAAASVVGEAVIDGGDVAGVLIRFRPAPHEENAVRARVTRSPVSRRPTFGWPSLTDRELGVVDVVAEGLTNREAASRLSVSPHTIDSHLRHIFRKLDIASRVELACLATARRTMRDTETPSSQRCRNGLHPAA
jgi:DNA-binding CsgD family transcriptional regulator